MRRRRLRPLLQRRIVGNLAKALGEVFDQPFQRRDLGGLREDRLVEVIDRLVLVGHGGFELFDPIVISSEVGADKPDAWIFQQALTEARCAAGRSLHVGDDPQADWQGAKEAGLQVFRLERPGNSLWDLTRELGVATEKDEG